MCSPSASRCDLDLCPVLRPLVLEMGQTGEKLSVCRVISPVFGIGTRRSFASFGD
jgi:hypothetical protein